MARPKVEMPYAGAEEAVVAMKLAKASRAKGRKFKSWKRNQQLDMSQLIWDTQEYMRRAGSRMKREFHVRFYRGLGVKFPRSTDSALVRQFSESLNPVKS